MMEIFPDIKCIHGVKGLQFNTLLGFNVGIKILTEGTIAKSSNALSQVLKTVGDTYRAQLEKRR